MSRTEFGHSGQEVALQIGLIALLLSFRLDGPATLVAHYSFGRGGVSLFHLSAVPSGYLHEGTSMMGNGLVVTPTHL